MSQLRSALERADAVFLARVVAQRERPTSGVDGNIYRTTLEVLEQFKGEVPQKLEMPSGTNGGDCSFRFEPAKTYLVYARRQGETLTTGHCTRSREISRKEDGELKWLRTRVPLPVPVALQRKVLTCDRCDLDTVTRKLLGEENLRDSCNLWLDDKDAREAFKAGRPFWAMSIYDEEADDHRSEAMGIAKEHRAFELTQTPYYGAEETCHQQVRLRWCKRLEPASREAWLPQFACIDPSPEIELCNEDKSRAGTPTPRETLAAIERCDWRDPDRPRCILSKTLRPVDAESPAAPFLSCVPRFSYPESYDYRCQVIVEPSPTTPGK